MAKTEPSLTGVRIISLVGSQGSGKSSVATKLAKRLGAQHIEASEVVAELNNYPKRIDMPKTNVLTATDPDWLGRAISDRFKNLRVVLSGVREMEVHEGLFKRGHTLAIASLWAPEQERYARVKEQGKCSDYVEFKEHEENELSMGLFDLLCEDYPVFCTSSFTNIDDVVDVLYMQLIDNWRVVEGNVL